MRRKKITLLSFGTRGDVQPLIALARELAAAGHEPVLAADARFEAWIRGHGVGFARLRFDLNQFLNTAEGREAMATEVEPEDAFERFVRPMLDDCWAAAQGADALIYDTMLIAANHMAEKLGIPALMTSVAPNMSPTRAFPPLGTPKLGWGGWGNKLSYQIYRLAWRSAAKDIGRWCETTLGFRPSPWHNYWQLRGRRVPIAYNYSPRVVPRPADWPEDYWAGGYWWLDEPGETPAAELQAFVAAGPPPVYIGFGSMVNTAPEKFTALVLAAVRESGQRAILAGGWGGLVPADLPSTVLFVETAPHAWLFPRVSAVVCHAGAGTTAAALRHGKPVVPCPLTGDQPFWSDVLGRNGWGTAPISQQSLLARERTADLAAAMRTAVSDEAMRRRVATLAGELAQERGATAAVEFIRNHLR